MVLVHCAPPSLRCLEAPRRVSNLSPKPNPNDCRTPRLQRAPGFGERCRRCFGAGVAWKTRFAGSPLFAGQKKGGAMRRLLIATAICCVALAAPTGAASAAPTILSGGGTGTFDGVNPGSQFGFGVVF